MPNDPATPHMVETKADALVTLPEIIPAASEKESAAKTGTDDTAFLQVRNSADRPGDSNRGDFKRQITTYSDDARGKNMAFPFEPETQNPPVAQGEMNGGERGIRTPGDLRLSGFQDRRLRPLGHLSTKRFNST